MHIYTPIDKTFLNSRFDLHTCYAHIENQILSHGQLYAPTPWMAAPQNLRLWTLLITSKEELLEK